jgi:hypothetical protein
MRKRDSGIPKSVAEVIDRAIADRIEERYQDAAEFRKALLSRCSLFVECRLFRINYFRRFRCQVSHCA